MSKETKKPKRKLPQKPKNAKPKDPPENLPAEAQRKLPFVLPVGASKEALATRDKVADETFDTVVFININDKRPEFFVGPEKTPYETLDRIQLMGYNFETGRHVLKGGKRVFELWKGGPIPPQPESEKTWFQERAKVSIKFPDNTRGLINIPPWGTGFFCDWTRKEEANGFDIFSGLYTAHAKIKEFANGNKAAYAVFELLGTADIIIDAEVADTPADEAWGD